MQTSTQLAIMYQRYLSNQLLWHAINVLVLDQMAQERPLPRNRGAKGVRFFRKPVADAGDVVPLTEGVAISSFKTLNWQNVDADLVPYGIASQISDIVSWTALIDQEKEIIETLGETAALFYDTVIRNNLVDPTLGLQQNYPLGIATRTFTFLAASGTPATAKLTVKDVLNQMIILRKQKARPFGFGGYMGAIPPEAMGDILNDTTYINIKSQGDTAKKDLYRGEMGELYNMKLMYGTNPFIENVTIGVYDTTGANPIQSSIFAGKDAFGVVSLEGMKPKSPRVLITTGAQKADPLDQYTIVGWKAYFAAPVLNPAFGTVLRHMYSFGT